MPPTDLSFYAVDYVTLHATHMTLYIVRVAKLL